MQKHSKQAEYDSSQLSHSEMIWLVQHLWVSPAPLQLRTGNVCLSVAAEVADARLAPIFVFFIFPSNQKAKQTEATSAAVSPAVLQS